MSKAIVSGKTVIVTGGERGIGRVTALRFAKGGYNVAVNYYSDEPLDLKQEIEDLSVRCLLVKGDVSSFEQTEVMVKAVMDEFGSIDALVNNAGITKDGLIMRMSESDFDRVIAINLKGAFNMTRHVSSIMIKQKSGAIVNLSSVSGVGGNAGQANYSASKAGLIGLTKTTASELASRGITCNAVAPGAIESDMTRALSDDVRAKMLEKIPLKRFGRQDEVSELIFFLAENRYITGEVVCIDGGMLLL